jgi:hypothetical protein
MLERSLRGRCADVEQQADALFGEQGAAVDRREQIGCSGRIAEQDASDQASIPNNELFVDTLARLGELHDFIVLFAGFNHAH